MNMTRIGHNDDADGARTIPRRLFSSSERNYSPVHVTFVRVIFLFFFSDFYMENYVQGTVRFRNYCFWVANQSETRHKVKLCKSITINFCHYEFKSVMQIASWRRHRRVHSPSSSNCNGSFCVFCSRNSGAR